MSETYVKNKKILLVDDEPELLQMVEEILREDGYRQIKTASCCAKALEACREWRPEFAVLDVMLPDGDGFSLFQQIKKLFDLPVLFLTARGEDEDKFKGLGLGADDYMVKPFLPRELVLRVGAILRRCYKNDSSRVRLSSCVVNLETAEVFRNGETIPLTAKEYELFLVLYRNAGKIVTIDLLCEALWGDNPYGYENSLMAHIRRLREKIESTPSKPVSLITIKGLGYKLIVED